MIFVVMVWFILLVGVFVIWIGLMLGIKILFWLLMVIMLEKLIVFYSYIEILLFGVMR